MSGTSLDGVDLAYIKFEFNQTWSFKIIYATTFKYDKIWLNKLKNAFNFSKNELKLLDDEYGIYLAELINQFINKNNINNINFIASHGHTIHHEPENGYTLQIGNGKLIAKLTGIKTVYDFRSQDVALGGQGAPLVPIGDELLFSNYTYCLNLGGFANISFKNKNNRLAYDICAVNTVLNHYTNKIDLDYDDNGKIASGGAVFLPLLNELNSLEYYHSTAPKSLGIEYVNDKLLPLIEKYNLEIKDILHTFIEHIAIQIGNNLIKEGDLLITGGGTFNGFLVERIKYHSTNRIVIPSEEVIDFKEALIFAFLGLLRLENKENCLKSVTGASKNHSSGLIAY
jgi:anhydro-N-acetylmuramic acid kinase